MRFAPAGYDLQPQFDYVNGKQSLREYLARNTVEVRVDEVARAGDVLDAAVGSGATSVSGVRFDLKDRTAAERDALRKSGCGCTRASRRGGCRCWHARRSRGQNRRAASDDTGAPPGDDDASGDGGRIGGDAHGARRARGQSHCHDDVEHQIGSTAAFTMSASINDSWVGTRSSAALGSRISIDAGGSVSGSSFGRADAELAEASRRNHHTGIERTDEIMVRRPGAFERGPDLRNMIRHRRQPLVQLLGRVPESPRRSRLIAAAATPSPPCEAVRRASAATRV